MNWNCFSNVAQVIETTILVATAVCGVVKYFHEKRIEKEKRTIEIVGELLEEYHEQFDEKGINTDYQKDVRYLSRIEQFCIAVDSKVYSKRTVKKYGSKFLSFLYKNYKDTVIAKRRKGFKNDENINYRYLEKLVKSFS